MAAHRFCLGMELELKALLDSKVASLKQWRWHGGFVVRGRLQGIGWWPGGKGQKVWVAAGRLSRVWGSVAVWGGVFGQAHALMNWTPCGRSPISLPTSYTFPVAAAAELTSPLVPAGPVTLRKQHNWPAGLSVQVDRTHLGFDVRSGLLQGPPFEAAGFPAVRKLPVTRLKP